MASLNSPQPNPLKDFYLKMPAQSFFRGCLLKCPVKIRVYKGIFESCFSVNVSIFFTHESATNISRGLIRSQLVHKLRFVWQLLYAEFTGRYVAIAYANCLFAIMDAKDVIIFRFI